MIKAETLWTGGRTNVCEMNDKVDLPGSFGNVIKIDEIYEHISIYPKQERHSWAGQLFCGHSEFHSDSKSPLSTLECYFAIDLQQCGFGPRVFFFKPPSDPPPHHPFFKRQAVHSSYSRQIIDTEKSFSLDVLQGEPLTLSMPLRTLIHSPPHLI